MVCSLLKIAVYLVIIIYTGKYRGGGPIFPANIFFGNAGIC